MENFPSITILKAQTWKTGACNFRVVEAHHKAIYFFPSICILSAKHGKFSTYLCLYRHVLDQPIEDQIEPVRAKKRVRPPVVMTQAEAQRVMSHIEGPHLLMAKILYGSGMRLMECIRLRVQDLDFDRNIIYVRDGKGGKDRTTLFPKSIQPELRQHLEFPLF